MRFENRRFITQDVMESIPLKRGTQGGGSIVLPN